MEDRMYDVREMADIAVALCLLGMPEDPVERAAKVMTLADVLYDMRHDRLANELEDRARAIHS